MPPKSRQTKRKLIGSKSRSKFMIDEDDEPSSCSTLLSSSVDDGTCGCPTNTVAKVQRGRKPRRKKALRRSKSVSKVKLEKLEKFRSKKCSNGKLDVNSCTITALRKEGIPVTMARKVVNYRKKHKCFVHINELMRIPGVKQAMFTQLQRAVGIKSNTEELNKLLKKRKSVAKSKSRAALSVKPSVTRDIRLPRLPAAQDTRSTTTFIPACSERSPPRQDHRMADYWPRGSASLSSVVTISPKPRKPKPTYDDKGRVRDDERQREHRPQGYQDRPQGYQDRPQACDYSAVRTSRTNTDHRNRSSNNQSSQNEREVRRPDGGPSRSPLPSHGNIQATHRQSTQEWPKQDVSCIIL